MIKIISGDDKLFEFFKVKGSKLCKIQKFKFPNSNTRPAIFHETSICDGDTCIEETENYGNIEL